MKGFCFILYLLIMVTSVSAQGTSGPDSADVLLLRGSLHLRKGEFRQASKDLLRSFTLRKEFSAARDSSWAENVLAIAEMFYEAGKPARAAEILQSTQNDLARFRGRESIQYARSTELLGLTSLADENYEMAESYLQAAGEKYSRTNGKISLPFARNLVFQGDLYVRQGSFTAAEALFRQARFIFSKLNDKSSDAFLTLQLSSGSLYVHLSNRTEAKEVLHQLMQQSTKTYGSSHPYIFKAKYLLGELHFSSSSFLRATKYAEEAHAGLLRFYGPSHPLLLRSASLLARCYASGKLYYKADSLFKTSLLHVHQEEKPLLLAEIESSHAYCYYLKGQYDSAAALHQKNLEVIRELLDNSHPFYIRTINDLAFLYWASGKKQLAENYFRHSAGNYISQFNRYFAFLSEQEKGYFHHDIRLFFDRYNSFILSRLKTHPQLSGEMYNHQLANKALLFHSAQEVRRQVLNSGDKNLLGKYQNWITMKEHLSKLYKLVQEDDSEENKLLLDSLEERANAAEKEISLRIELDKKHKTAQVQDVNWKEIRKILAPDEASIEIVRVPEFKPDSGGRFSQKVTYAFLIVTSRTVNHPAVVLITNGEEIETKQLRYYRNCIQHQISDELSYKNFWSPLVSSGYLKDIKKIYISPDGVYNQINLNTLADPATSKTLFEETDIHLLSNTKDLIRQKASSEKPAEIRTTLFGYPDYYNNSGQNLNNNPGKTEHHVFHRTRGQHSFQGMAGGGRIAELPGTKAEVEEIAAIMEARSLPYKAHLGADASEQTLKSVSNPSILHIATHGYFLPDISAETSDADTLNLNSYAETPLVRSGIMLVGAGNAYTDETLEKELHAVLHSEKFEDGILTAYEAMNINLANTDLVILSACETGLGDVQNGEGVYGLQRALQTAGARSVIMSLWKVSDQATKKLMIYFYNELVTSGDKRLAFRNAQEKLKQEFSEPLYWGAFVMTGE